MHKFKLYKEMIDIDYYVYFSKAYFAFNAYLKAKYPTENDRGKIKKIKESHVLRNKFKNLIFEGKHFRDDLNSLNQSLENALIENQEELIHFRKVRINDHTEKDIFKRKFNGVDYHIRAIPAEKFFFKVGHLQSNPFIFEELESQVSASNLSPAQKEKVTSEINGFVQQYSLDLQPFINQLGNFETIGIYDQNNLVEKLYQGVVEICYLLRNALFHSEVEPNSDVMRVYKFAYFILRKIIKEIPST
jgi:hypothetical protein